MYKVDFQGVVETRLGRQLVQACQGMALEVLGRARKVPLRPWLKGHWESNPLQPTLLMKFEKIYLTVHVYDVLMIGKPEELNNFVKFLEKKRWKMEVNGPFEEGSTNFNYLKMEFELNGAGCNVRPDTKRIRELAKVVMLQSHHVPKKVPGKNTFNQKDESTPWYRNRTVGEWERPYWASLAEGAVEAERQRDLGECSRLLAWCSCAAAKAGWVSSVPHR